MSNMAVNTLRALIEIIDDKKERKALKSELDRLAQAEGMVNDRIEELEDKQKAFNDSHTVTMALHEAETYLADAHEKFDSAEQAAGEIVDEAQIQAEGIVEEANALYRDVGRREKEAKQKIAEYNQKSASFDDYSRKQEQVLSKREKSVSEREAQVASLKEEYEAKYKTLKESLAKLQ